jgi:hypothetical protein
LFASSSVIGVIKSRRLRWEGHVAWVRMKKNTYKILVRKPERKRPLRRLRHRWENNVRMNLKEMVWVSVDWIHLSQDRDQRWALTNTVMNLQVP